MFNGSKSLADLLRMKTMECYSPCINSKPAEPLHMQLNRNFYNK